MVDALATPLTQPESAEIRLRDATLDDIPKIVRLDALNTDLPKPEFWNSTFARFGGRPGRYFLIAEQAESGMDAEEHFLGFIVGEIRAWEFGSPPCGWILTIGVMPEHRVRGIGGLLFEEICERLRADGVTMVRTMLARDDTLNMSFFRSQGLMAGSFIELEKEID